MPDNLPGNVRFERDEGTKGVLDIGDILAFPADQEGREAQIEYNEDTAPLINAIVTADDEYPSFRLNSEDGHKQSEAFVTYDSDAARLTLQSVRFTGNIIPYVQIILKRKMLVHN